MSKSHANIPDKITNAATRKVINMNSMNSSHYSNASRSTHPSPGKAQGTPNWTLTPTGQILGARIDGFDLSRPMQDLEFRALIMALGQYGVISFSKQNLSAQGLKDFSANFGELEINVANMYQAPGIPEVMILSNMKKDGVAVGIADAGQDWHTDMSYSRMIAFSNVLHGIQIPVRDGVSLGNTEFSCMKSAYQSLSDKWKETLDGCTATHDFEKFWNKMRFEKGSTRPPLTAQQKASKPPVNHPLVMEHPITHEKVLYANPGYATRINEMEQSQSDVALAHLFEHQLQPRFRYQHVWQEGDVLMWDNFGTIHNAVADYTPDEPRYIHRCQVMATRFFNADGTPKTRQATGF